MSAKESQKTLTDLQSFHKQNHRDEKGTKISQPKSGEPKAGIRIDLPVREIKNLFESFKGIRISNRLAYLVQESLIHGEGEQVGPTLDVDGVKTKFAINGLPSLSGLRKALLYRSLQKSRLKDGTIDVDHTAKFLRMTQKGMLKPADILRRRLLLEGITLSSDCRDIRVRGGLTFEELSFDFEAPREGLDISDFGKKLLRAIYQFHDCSVEGTARFFHTNEQLMWGMLKRAGVEFETPPVLKMFHLPPELEKQFGPAIREKLMQKLQPPMTDILRTAKARAGKKKIANRKFLDEMEERLKNYIQLVLVPEFGISVINEENSSAIHASAWHFLQWEIGQFRVEDILNLDVVSPYEMMFSRVLRRLGLTPNGCPVFFNKDFTTHYDKPYAPNVVTFETLILIFRYFKTADLLESSFHETIQLESESQENPQKSLLAIELKHLQRYSLEIRENEIKSRLQRIFQKVKDPTELHGVLSVEVKQILASLQEILEIPVVHFFGIASENYQKIPPLIQETIEKIQRFIRNFSEVSKDFESIQKAYIDCLAALNSLCKKYQNLAVKERCFVNTWASLFDLYQILYRVKGLDPPKRRKKKKPQVAPTAPRAPRVPMLHYGPLMEEILPEQLIRATFVFSSDSFKKLNLIPPHLRTFFVIDEPNNHMGQYHLAAWAFRIHWKRRRLGQGQKHVADDYIRSLRFLRCFVYRKDKKGLPYLMLCNVDSDSFGQAKLAEGGTILNKTKRIAQSALHIPANRIIEISHAEEPANEHDKIEFFLSRIAKGR